MALSVRTRFEVFKRDKFACVYCGKAPPNTLLEVDHVLPIAAGGTDAIENLVTSCWDCNHGKAARLLEEGSAPSVSTDAVDRMAERVAQARAYAEYAAELRGLEDNVRDLIVAGWATAFGAVTTEKGWRFDGYGAWPNDRTLYMFLRRLPVDSILDAVTITGSRFDGVSSDAACRYFYAICWKRIRGEA